MSSDQRSDADSDNSDHLTERTSETDTGLLKSTSSVSAMTLLSRILGLVRDVVFARFFGAGIVMDAFFVANKIPNMLRRFSGEGAFSQGFVPVMARYREKHTQDEAREFVDSVAGTFGLLLFVITLIGVIAAPILVLIFAPGFVDGDGRLELATAMVRFTFPYLLFISLVAFAGGILNTYGRFAAPAFTPVILNVVLISFAIYVAPTLDEPGMALAYGVFVAGVVQLLFQIPFLAKIKSVPRPRWNPKHAGVRRAGKLMLPAIFGSSVAQINVLIGSVIASVLGVGKISYIYYSDRLMEFPLGLFGIALATVTLPFLSRQHATDSHQGFSDTVDWSLRLIVLIALPSAVGLAVLASPLVATIFYGGEFTQHDLTMTAVSLQAFSFGLVGFSLVKILAPAYFAREDTRTPVKIALIALLLNVVLSITFAWTLGKMGFEATHVGLALATSISAMVNAWLLYAGLRRDKVVSHRPGWLLLTMRVLAANIVMLLVLYFFDRPLEYWVSATLFSKVGWLTVTVTASVTVYAASLYVSGLRPSHLRIRSE
jgi:putative peptidoglycan lipid II flippase